MNEGRSVFSQLMDFLPLHRFRPCVERYAQVEYTTDTRRLSLVARAAPNSAMHRSLCLFFISVSLLGFGSA
jgi:hypothetical protein